MRRALLRSWRPRGRPCVRRASDLAALPSQARVVVVGGGIIGTSTAYHLAKRGWRDVVLVERDALTSGTTWHAAGLMVTFGSLSSTSTEWRKYSKELYGSILERETGQSTGFRPCGFVELAPDGDRLEEYRRIAAFNRKEGVDVQEIGAAEVERLFPLCRVDDVLAGFYVADDGRVNPVDATAALAKGFRQMGGTIVEGVAALDVVGDGSGGVAGVTTTCGREVRSEYVVNCGGMWARQLGERHGVCVPNQAAEHYYLVTEAMDDVDPDWPVVEDPSSHTYVRPEGGGLMVGLFEPEAAAWKVEGIPEDFSFGEIEPDWDRMAPFLERACARVPAAADAGVKKFFCGPESFAPDLAPLVGEAPELKRYFVAAGLNSIGILTGPGVGRTVANWIVDGFPDVDVCGVHVDRGKDYARAPLFRGLRVEEALGEVYKCHYPYKTPQSARNVLRTPLHAEHARDGAAFRAVGGFEAPDWFGADAGALTWRTPAFFDAWRREHLAVRTTAGLVDMSFMSKFAVSGRDALAVLQRLSTANIEEGITYTQWLHPSKGTLEADLTVTRLPEPWAKTTGLAPSMGASDASPKFLVVATDTAHRHVLALLTREIRHGEVVAVSDVTGGLAQLALQGPRSRDVLRAAVATAADEAAVASLPFRGVGRLTLGFCPNVLATRITYVGELGYELFVPSEHAADVHDRLVDAGAAFDLRKVGLKALGSLRLEKGYRDFGHDVDNCDTPFDVGLAFTCDYDKDFNGRAKCLEHKAQPRKRRLISLVLQDPAIFAHHGEVVYRDGALVGDVRAASYGHTVGGAVGLAMVHAPDGARATKRWIDDGAWEVDVAGVRVPANASLGPPYDPKGARIKA